MNTPAQISRIVENFKYFLTDQELAYYSGCAVEFINDYITKSLNYESIKIVEFGRVQNFHIMKYFNLEPLDDAPSESLRRAQVLGSRNLWSKAILINITKTDGFTEVKEKAIFYNEDNKEIVPVELVTLLISTGKNADVLLDRLKRAQVPSAFN